MVATWRATQKANRRALLLASAASLFAERGYAAVSTVELGEAAGMTGPALYKHFRSKEALLAELLIDASTRLLDGCRQILSTSNGNPLTDLQQLIDFHLDFALSDPDVIRVQDRELPHLLRDASRQVRMLQRKYVDEWDAVLAQVRTELTAQERRARLLGVFGLLNSTPYSARIAGDRAPRILSQMALRALVGDDCAVRGG